MSRFQEEVVLRRRRKEGHCHCHCHLFGLGFRVSRIEKEVVEEEG